MADPSTAADAGKVRTVPVANGTYIVVAIAEELDGHFGHGPLEQTRVKSKLGKKERKSRIIRLIKTAARAGSGPNAARHRGFVAPDVGARPTAAKSIHQKSPFRIPGHRGPYGGKATSILLLRHITAALMCRLDIGRGRGGTFAALMEADEAAAVGALSHEARDSISCARRSSRSHPDLGCQRRSGRRAGHADP